MSRHTVLNLVLGAVAAVLVATLVYLEATDDAADATTTTTSTTTSTTSTTTTLPPDTTTTTSTTTSTTSTTTTIAPYPRQAYQLLVVNGSSVGGRLDPTIGLLRLAGYEDLRGVSGAVRTPTTTVYYLGDAFIGAAARLAEDVGVDPTSIAPWDEAPPIPAVGDAQLIVYLGGV
jgi:hypothetical protein